MNFNVHMWPFWRLVEAMIVGHAEIMSSAVCLYLWAQIHPLQPLNATIMEVESKN